MSMFYDKLNGKVKSISAGSVTLKLNRYKARKFYETNEVDITGDQTIFGQMFTGLKSTNPDRYLCKKDNRLFTVKLQGEGATDQGGPFRDVLFTAFEELQSSSLDLFIKSPNNKSEIGSMRDKYIINPSANLEIHYEMYTFLGRFMAFAICSGNSLNVNIHPVIWKLLLGQEIKFGEYETVDKMYYKFISDLEKTCAMMKSAEEFENSFDLFFTIQISNGTEKELLPNGKNIKLDFSNKEKFIELAKKERINEFDNQIKKIKCGLYEVLNESLLQLLTWRELEELVCGKPTLDVSVLKGKTNYEVNKYSVIIY
jgi:E3 ubiquitin-protein ligase HERC1